MHEPTPDRGSTSFDFGKGYVPLNERSLFLNDPYARPGRYSPGSKNSSEIAEEVELPDKLPDILVDLQQQPITGIDQYKLKIALELIEIDRGLDYYFDLKAPDAVKKAADIANRKPHVDENIRAKLRRLYLEDNDTWTTREHEHYLEEVLKSIVHDEYRRSYLTAEAKEFLIRTILESPLPTGESVNPELQLINSEIELTTRVPITISNYQALWPKVPTYLGELWLDAMRRRISAPDDTTLDQLPTSYAQWKMSRGKNRF